jgi:uncharacterized membrane protein
LFYDLCIIQGVSGGIVNILGGGSATFWSIVLYGAETWTIRAVIRNTWKVLKCGAGEGWKRSVGLIM